MPESTQTDIQAPDDAKPAAEATHVLKRPDLVLRLLIAADGNVQPEEDPRLGDEEHASLTNSPALAGERFWAAFHPKPQSTGVFGTDASTAESASEIAALARLEFETLMARLDGKPLRVSRGLSRHCTPAALKRLEKFLRPRCRRIRLEIHLCRPERHMAFHFIRQLEKPSGNWRIPHALPAYQKLLERFETAFHRHSITYQIVESCEVLNPEVVYSMHAVALLYAYRSYCWFHRDARLCAREHREVFKALESVGERGFGFSNEAVNNAMSFRTKDIEWLESRLNGPLGEHGKSDGITSGEELLLHSVDATDHLTVPAWQRDASQPRPRTAREAAECLVDCIHRLLPSKEALGGPFAKDLNEAAKEQLTQAGLLAMEEAPTCYIHVGMPKTGTTSIQSALSSFRPSTDFEYLKIPPANHSRLIFTAFSKSPERLPYYRKLGLAPEQIDPIKMDYMKRLERQVNLNRSRKLFLSGETIYQLREDELHEMAEFFHSRSTKVRIIAYLRPIQSFMESVFQQRLKRGIAVEQFKAVYPDYARRIRAFDAAFGEENVIVRPFDRALYPNGDVVVDFCQLSGIALHDYTPSKLNESMCTEAVAVLYAFHRFGGNTGIGEDSMNLSGEFVELLQTLEGRRFSLARSVVDRVVEAHQDDIHWIENRTGFSLVGNAAEDRTYAIRSFRKLLARSMDGARMLIEATAHEYPHRGPLPATPLEVACFVRDYLKWKRPDLPVTLDVPERSGGSSGE